MNFLCIILKLEFVVHSEHEKSGGSVFFLILLGEQIPTV